MAIHCILRPVNTDPLALIAEISADPLSNKLTHAGNCTPPRTIGIKIMHSRGNGVNVTLNVEFDDAWIVKLDSHPPRV